MSNFSQRIANLSPEKLALLEQRLMKKPTPIAKKQVIPRRQTSEPSPLSFSQQRLWFLNQLEPNSPYNISIGVRLTGTLNVEALQQTLNAIVVRHDALRTTFVSRDDRLIQIIAETQTVKLSIIDLSDLYDIDIENAAQRILKKETLYPFNLSSDLMLRATLLRLSEQEHILVLVMHHVASDGWSVGILFHELAGFYEAFSTGSPSPFPELPIQYADFAYWQRQWFSGEVLQTQINYWKQQLAAAPQLLELPTDHPRPSVQTFRGSTEYFQLDHDLTQKLKTLSQQSGVSLFMTLLAAFATLLSRYSGQEDIIVGSPIANRQHSELESLIGLFVNTLVLRTQLQGNPTFLELLERVKEMTLGAYAHQDLPFERLVEELQPQRSLSYSPLFQVMFVLQNAPIGKLELPGLSITPLQLEEESAKFDLTLSIEETPSGLDCWWQYNTDLFNAATIKQIALNYQTMLYGIVANPIQHVAQLPLLSSQQEHQLLWEWNSTDKEYPQHQCIHQLFEQQVEKTPDAVAVVFENQQLTYQQLNHRANQLAHHLQTLGVGPEVLVGICVERSLLMIVGVLGILKAGGAYVPLDPAYPEERLSFMLSDSQVSVLVTQQKLVAALPSKAMSVVGLDTEWEIICQQSQLNPTSSVQASNLAYVIYTSGSTGKPKGVLVPHQGLCNLALEQMSLFHVQTNSRVLQFASLSFDASISEIMMTLCAGAQLCLATKDSLLPGPGLIDLMQNQAITHVTLPPSALAAMPSAQLPDLQTLIVAGEACSPHLVEQWSFNRRFFNAYGPTEATVCATTAMCIGGNHKLPIGRPIGNTQVYILDQHLQPVPIGVAGELHIGGVGLARGYLNRPELTQQKFIPNPFNNSKLKTQNSKLYKTGDLARYLADGNIEYLGRTDSQVKIRGFRIELGEIETVLSQHPLVREVAVIARVDQPGNPQLVAYVVSNSKSDAISTELRSFLKQTLPEYMIPSAFVSLEKIPLTPNGKLDRRTLPAPDFHQSLTVSYVPPQTPTQEVLAHLWAQVLGMEKVGIHNNFFELGGHSLLATQLISRLQTEFCIQLSLRRLFESPTIAELSETIETFLWATQDSAAFTKITTAKREEGEI
ncbi:non-ribosomal peptide synthetase [Aetokthonos hydrillicola Thurmond2011]|jgi:amino acid adenylation domain-containing protein|uniref:Non-ribosomal peptide synthetase n=1 Tax=Aetokthonos hydrillicola Thurmond2011 TaxID=2712845 RepID=A0AAP5I9W3_9CYAN|nr:non-ribosomal peptide synthetase [Aetokthonos hydrillicola]MBO3462193.1 amino acid adenylation domain-containing protein [Aetokthonos hydrillicola CCALA 1050]MBW4588559.1 amino acid adenylation domain-containing protein [Aetokthonos hydrillicola CCALA 1050]MDR9896232.1 non-ribosomal peptide synthetase [Aetokthonos hydrillicola Thurmond2011]